MCGNSHSHAYICGHCAAYTAQSTPCIHGGPHIHSHQAVTGCNSACAHLDTICKSLQVTNTSMNIELERLRLEVSRLKGMQPGGNYGDNSTILRPHITSWGVPASCSTGNEISWSNGAGAGSRDIYEEMCRTNWHGRLGYVHMADVDRLSPEKLKDLDGFLRRNIAKHFPIRGKVVSITDSTRVAMWAGFKEIGLKLDSRTYFSGLKDTSDYPTWPVMQRMRNKVAYCHQHGTSWGWYWNMLVNETLLECARYRGLFRSDGTFS